jgi:uncharacterized protein (TIGR02145 family)
MNSRTSKLLNVLIITAILTSITCKKDELIKVTKIQTGTISEITYTSAKASAEFIDLGSNISSFGHCWNKTGNPEITDSKNLVTGTAKKGEFISNLAGLSAGTKYYVRAFATDGSKAVFGNQIEFSTNSYDLPVLTTSSISSISYTTAISGGEITSDGGTQITARGVCWATTQNPTIEKSKTNNGTGKGIYTSNISGLTSNTTYYVRAYATNSEGTAYGNQQSFTTIAYNLPSVSTTAVSSISHNSAVSGGNVANDGGSAVIERGVCWGISHNPTITENHGMTKNGSGTGTFTSILSSLTANTTYYVRAYATNAAGTKYGGEVDFTTSVTPNIIITWPNSTTHWLGLDTANIKWTSNISGNIKIELFKGISIITEIEASILNDGFHQWESVINGQYSTDFKIRITSLDIGGFYAESPAFKISESTGSTGSVIGEAKTYKTIKIGYQWWMAENIRERKYTDGTSITEVQMQSGWANLGSTDKAYCYYLNHPTNLETYGNLYTWPAAMNGTNSSGLNPSGVQGVCPIDWHLPSDAEWKQLEMYLGIGPSEVNDQGYRGTNEGSKLAGNASLWSISTIKDDPAFNSSGFTAVPGGRRVAYSGEFLNLGTNAYWWCSTLAGAGYDAYNRMLSSSYTSIYRYYDGSRPHGYSVRCVRN